MTQQRLQWTWWALENAYICFLKLVLSAGRNTWLLCYQFLLFSLLCVSFLFLALCDYLEWFGVIIIFTCLSSICFNPLSLQIWFFFFSFLALSLEVNSFFSLCEDFLSGAFVCVTISSFLNTTLASSEPLSYLLPCHPRSHLKSCRRWQITQSPAVLQRLRFWLKSCLFLTDTSLSPRRVWWLWMAEGKVSQGLYDAFIPK